MDLSLLARDLVIFITPALPFLIGVGQSATGRVVGEGVSATIKTIWGKLRPKVEAKPAAEEAAKDLAENPADEDAQAAFRVQMKKLLEGDADLAQELATLMTEAKSSGQFVIASGERSVAIGGDANDNTIITGDGNTVHPAPKYQVNMDKAQGVAIGDQAKADVSPQKD